MDLFSSHNVRICLSINLAISIYFMFFYKTSDLKKYYRESIYRNSIAMMLNYLLISFVGLIFWMFAARTSSASDIGQATAIVSAAALINSISRLGMDAELNVILA